jgi:Arc/MetJ-type ribon-helix-helix transcriptional regulator
MGRYTENKGIMVSEEQAERIEQRAKEGPYESQADYVRSMLEAGESHIAALDPRTTDGESAGEVTHESAEVAARSLSDGVLVDKLPDGESDKEDFDEVVGDIRDKFETVIGNRLLELAQEDSSPVETDGQGNYWREGGQ